LWRFGDNMSVIYWEIICAKILFYIYCFRVRHLYTVQQRWATQMWQRCYWRQGEIFVIKSSQTTQLYITKVINKDFSCHHNIKITLLATNLFKINILWFSSITRLKQILHYVSDFPIFFILDDIPHSSLERKCFFMWWWQLKCL
jgi:hypothetical protein